MGKHIICKSQNITHKSDKLAMSIEFERCGAFLRIKTDAFGNLNPKEIKENICKAIDRYYELAGD